MGACRLFREIEFYYLKHGEKMKHFLIILVALISNVTWAQGLPDQIVVMDFFKVETSEKESFLKKENIWKKVHQQRIKESIITGWYLYKVRYAGEEYNYVSIHTYSDFNKLENPFPSEIITNLSVDKDLKNVSNSSGRKVKSEMSKLVAFTGKSKPSKYMLMAFTVVDEKDKGAYVKGENTIWKPTHQELIATSSQDWWAVYELKFPHGLSVNYQFVTISAVSDFSDMNKLDYLGAYNKAHKNRDFKADVDNTLKMRTAHRAELWELVDSLE